MNIKQAYESAQQKSIQSHTFAVPYKIIRHCFFKGTKVDWNACLLDDYEGNPDDVCSQCFYDGEAIESDLLFYRVRYNE
jgi:hypothetical protein